MALYVLVLEFLILNKMMQIGDCFVDSFFHGDLKIVELDIREFKNFLYPGIVID
jgi:hypothetical protein